MNLSSSIAREIKSHRTRDLSMTQNEFANKIGVSTATLSAWERGIREPSIPYIIIMSEVFNVTIDHLIGLEKMQGAVMS